MKGRENTIRTAKQIKRNRSLLLIMIRNIGMNINEKGLNIIDSERNSADRGLFFSR
jgi:hypothetical protein